MRSFHLNKISLDLLLSQLQIHNNIRMGSEVWRVQTSCTRGMYSLTRFCFFCGIDASIPSTRME